MRDESTPKFCKCGCGGEAKPGNLYINGHSLTRTRSEAHRKAISASLIARHAAERESGKVCPKCKKHKPPHAFKIRTKVNYEGTPYLRSYCQQCEQEEAFKRRLAERYVPERSRRSHLRKRYGITPEQYDEMFVAQGGRCAICGTDDPGPRIKHFHVDHCHETGKIRGLLCQLCNGLIGHGRENVYILGLAIEYLERTR